MPKISASRLKVLNGCSWVYWSKYHLKLPDESNNGARRGSVSHSLFEVLLKPKHRHIYDLIIKSGSIYKVPQIKRFINIQCKKNGLVDECDNKGNHNLDLIDKMCMVGLKHDFFCTKHKGLIESPETEFEYTHPDLGYTIYGFIDKISKHRDKLHIWDYKSSADKYKGDDKESNLQAFMYSLYSKRVRGMDAIVKFVFLRFPEDPIMEVEFSDDELNGFERYLSYINGYIEKFNKSDAISNMAYDQGFPGKDQGFCKRLMCGFSSYEGQLKKDGTIMYSCAYKWPFSYYALKDDKGKIIRTSKSSILPGPSETVETMRYNGCPRFQNKNSVSYQLE